MGRDVFGNDASGADDDIVSDGDTGEDGNAPSEPDVIPDRNGKGRFNARIAQIGVNGVVGGIDADIGADEGIFSDGDFSAIQHSQVVIDIGIFPDADIVTVIAMEGRFDMEVFRGGSQPGAYQVVAFPDEIRFHGIELVNNPFDGSSVGNEFGIHWMIQRGGQHFFLFSHGYLPTLPGRIRFCKTE